MWYIQRNGTDGVWSSGNNNGCVNCRGGWLLTGDISPPLLPFLRSPTESFHHPIPIHNPHSHTSPISTASLSWLLSLVCFVFLGTIASLVPRRLQQGHVFFLFSFSLFLNFGCWVSILLRVSVRSWVWFAMPIDGCGGLAWHGLWMIFLVDLLWWKVNSVSFLLFACWVCRGDVAFLSAFFFFGLEMLGFCWSFCGV